MKDIVKHEIKQEGIDGDVPAGLTEFLKLYSCKNCGKSYSVKSALNHQKERCKSSEFDQNNVNKELDTETDFTEKNIEDQKNVGIGMTLSENITENHLMLEPGESSHFVDCGESIKQEIKEEVHDDSLNDPLYLS